MFGVISGLSGKHRKLMPAHFYSSVDLSVTFTAGRERQRWWDRDAFGTRLPAVYSAIQRTDKWISFLDLRLCVSIELCSKTWMDGRPLSAFCRYDFRSGNVRSLNKVWGVLFSLVAGRFRLDFLWNWFHAVSHTCKTGRYYPPVATSELRQLRLIF